MIFWGVCTLKEQGVFFLKKSTDATEDLIQSNENLSLSILDKESISTETSQCVKTSDTVITDGVRFEGDLLSEDKCIYVYGEVYGDIKSPKGTINIMNNALVKGNVECQHLVVDGYITGHCNVESVCICKNGRIEGNLLYKSLTVKTGGNFKGQIDYNNAEMDAHHIQL